MWRISVENPSIFTLPHDYISLMESINQGIPLGEAAPKSKLWRQLLELAKDLVERAAKGRQNRDSQ